MFVFSLILCLAIAMSSVLSRQIGGGNEETICRIATHGLALALMTGIIIAAIGTVFMNQIFSAMGAEAALMPKIREYMTIWFGGAIFITMPIVGNAAIRATGDTIRPAIIMGIVALVNILLDPVLIFGLFGFPRLEMQGAAIATVLANAIAMCCGLYLLYFKKKILRFRPFHPELFMDTAKKLGFIALPAGLTNTIQPFTNAVIISLLAKYGTENVAAFGIVSRVEAFAFVVIMGLAGGIAPIIGQNWGAKKYERVNETLHKAFKFSVLWALFIALIFGLFAKQIAGLFSGDALVIHTAALYFWIVPVTYALANLIQGWASAFNAMGLPQRAAMMIIGKHLFIQIPAAYIGGQLYGVADMFFGIALTNILLGASLHMANWRLCKSRQTD
jgi:putative MATE family efflux protein